jgi:hypothetical protein
MKIWVICLLGFMLNGTIALVVSNWHIALIEGIFAAAMLIGATNLYAADK